MSIQEVKQEYSPTFSMDCTKTLFGSMENSDLFRSGSRDGVGEEVKLGGAYKIIPLITSDMMMYSPSDRESQEQSGRVSLPAPTSTPAPSLLSISSSSTILKPSVLLQMKQAYLRGITIEAPPLPPLSMQKKARIIPDSGHDVKKKCVTSVRRIEKVYDPCKHLSSHITLRKSKELSTAEVRFSRKRPIPDDIVIDANPQLAAYAIARHLVSFADCFDITDVLDSEDIYEEPIRKKGQVDGDRGVAEENQSERMGGNMDGGAKGVVEEKGVARRGVRKNVKRDSGYIEYAVRRSTRRQRRDVNYAESSSASSSSGDSSDEEYHASIESHSEEEKEGVVSSLSPLNIESIYANEPVVSHVAMAESEEPSDGVVTCEGGAQRDLSSDEQLVSAVDYSTVDSYFMSESDGFERGGDGGGDSDNDMESLESQSTVQEDMLGLADDDTFPPPLATPREVSDYSIDSVSSSSPSSSHSYLSSPDSYSWYEEDPSCTTPDGQYQQEYHDPTSTPIFTSSSSLQMLSLQKPFHTMDLCPV